MRLLGLSLMALALLGASCKCGDSGLGPLAETKPADLGPTGVLVQQPKDGETLTGQWVAVSGWFDRTKFDNVVVIGGTSADLYAPGGHVGIPSTPILVSDEGRFLAPRVPLDDGATTLQVLAFKDGAVALVTAVNVTGSGVTSAPVTIVADPPVATGTTSVKLSAFTGMGAVGWQWDFEGDGTFDSEEATPTHSYAEGRWAPMARTKIDNRYVYGVAVLVVSAPGTVSQTNTTVTEPRSISVVPDFMGGTRSVLVVDGDAVRVFSPTLDPQATAMGLQAPSAAVGDALGRFYVSDTGHNAVKRFTAAGALDVTFADGGVLGGIPSPGSLALEPRPRDQDDGGTETAWRLSVLDGTGKLTSFDPAEPGIQSTVAAPFGIDRDTGTVAKGFVQPLTPLGTGASGGVWFHADDQLYQPGLGTPVTLPQFKGAKAYAPGWDAVQPYVAVIDAQGKLQEVLGAPWNRRLTDVGYAATAVALDAAATAAQHETADPGGAWSVGPVVLYVGGKGKLERRVMPLMRGIR